MSARTPTLKKPCSVCGTPIERPRRAWERAKREGRRPCCSPACRNVLDHRDHPRPVTVYVNSEAPFRPKTPEEHIVCREYVTTVRAGRASAPPEYGPWTLQQMIDWERADAAESALRMVLSRLKELRGES